MPGALGAPVLVKVHGGELIVPPGAARGGETHLHVYVAGREVADVLLRDIVDALSQRGLNA